MWIKILLLVLAIAAIWYAFRVFNRPAKSKAAASPTIERTTKCTRCGVYVPTVNAQPCGREGCPYPPPARSGAP